MKVLKRKTESIGGSDYAEYDCHEYIFYGNQVMTNKPIWVEVWLNSDPVHITLEVDSAGSEIFKFDFE